MIQRFTQDVCESPIFIIGSPRSGTSVLGWALHQHPVLWTSRESDLFFNMLSDRKMEKAFDAARSRPEGTWLSEQSVEQKEFLGYLGLGLNALWTNRSKGKRWVDQTPVNTAIVDDLADLFPGAVFLHIVRDPRRVVHSMINFRNMLSDQMDSAFQEAGQVVNWMTDFGEAVKTWCWFVDRAMTFAENHPERCLTFTNESLSASPAEGFENISAFLGIENHEGPAKFFRETRLNSSFSKTPDASPGPRNSRPWQGWTEARKLTFLDGVVPVLQKHRIFPEFESPDWMA